MPWGDPTYVSRDLVAHLRLRHRCDYTVLTDFEADEEAMFNRAIGESLRTAGLEGVTTEEEDERVLAQILQLSAQESGVAVEGASSSSDGADGEDGSSESGGSVAEDSSTSAAEGLLLTQERGTQTPPQVVTT